LLAQIATEPEKAIGEYDLVTPEARSISPDPAAPLDSGWVGAIHEMFSRHVENSPARLAVCDALGHWTYGELDRASNQLANYLLASGIKAKDAIAIYAQRGASLIVALLGVLKAGGVFTILDPTYPAARLLSYLRIARPKGWLQPGSGELPEELSKYLETVGFECRLVLPTNKSEFPEMFRDINQAKPPLAITANDPAYIAFTSGSTGEAKGVLCRHGSITHFLPWQTNAFGLSGNDRFALLSGLAYNHLHRDVFTALAMGASVYIPPPEIAREPVQLCHWLRENSITVLHVTPA
jgi:non-ribosomal peptide synthetase component F